MTDAQPHDYATAPTGVHELPQELQPNADLHARLTRPSVGADDDEAVALIAALPAVTIRSESDELLAQRVKDFRRDGEIYDPSAHSISDVEKHVGDDVDKARDVLAKEKVGKDRSTLVAKLEKLVATDQATTPPVVATPGDAADGGAPADGPHV